MTRRTEGEERTDSSATKQNKTSSTTKNKATSTQHIFSTMSTVLNCRVLYAAWVFNSYPWTQLATATCVLLGNKQYVLLSYRRSIKQCSVNFFEHQYHVIKGSHRQRSFSQGFAEDFSIAVKGINVSTVCCGVMKSTIHRPERWCQERCWDNQRKKRLYAETDTCSTEQIIQN